MPLSEGPPPRARAGSEESAQRTPDTTETGSQREVVPSGRSSSDGSADVLDVVDDTGGEAMSGAEQHVVLSAPADSRPETPIDSREPSWIVPEESVVGETGPPVPVPRESLCSEVLERLDTLTGQMAAMQQLFESRILHSESEGQINARLHAELQSLKNDLYAKLVKPILQDVITVREHLLKVSAARRLKPAGEQVIDLGTFESFADDLAQVLEDNDVEIRRSTVGAEYEPQWHQAVGRVDTTDPAVHRTLATATGDAYSFQGRALARQRVTVFDYRASQIGSTS